MSIIWFKKTRKSGKINKKYAVTVALHVAHVVKKILFYFLLLIPMSNDGIVSLIVIVLWDIA